MPDNDPKPPARPFFRKLALAAAIVCFLFAVVFAATPIPLKNKWFTVEVCVIVGLVMLTIGMTGHWPGPKR